MENMTLQELKDRLEKNESENFYLEMKDRWSEDDYKLNNKLYQEKVELKKRIAELEAEIPQAV